MAKGFRVPVTQPHAKIHRASPPGLFQGKCSKNGGLNKKIIPQAIPSPLATLSIEPQAASTTLLSLCSSKLCSNTPSFFTIFSAPLFSNRTDFACSVTKTC